VLTRIAALLAFGSARFGPLSLAALTFGSALLAATTASSATSRASSAAAPLSVLVLLALPAAPLRLTIAPALGLWLRFAWALLLSRACLPIALRASLASATATLRSATTPSTAALAGAHVKLGAVLERVFTQRRADLGATRADSEKPATGMVKNLDLDTVAADPELVQRDLDGLVDSDSLCFDRIRHDKGLS
jgi:hypothetical protein